MKTRSFGTVVLLCCAVPAYGIGIIVDLGTADPFGVLAGSAVTNTGSSIINGDVGVWPSGAITGFPPGIVNGTTYMAGAVAMQAQTDLTTAYNFAAGQACDMSLTGQNLGGLTLTPGVYCFSSSADLTGALTLDAQGNPNAVFLFQIGSTLTTASASSVLFTNGGQGGSVFWQIGSSATLGTDTSFAGDILALTSITLNTGASIPCGRALAQNGAVTMDTNAISISPSGGCGLVANTVPEPSSVSLLGIGVLLGLVGCSGRFGKLIQQVRK
jgi:Ice-binding-like/PEP-CTERM motif